MGITTRWLSATVLCDFQKVRETCSPWKFITGVAKLLRLPVFLSPGFIWPSVEQISQRQLTHAIGEKDSWRPWRGPLNPLIAASFSAAGMLFLHSRPDETGNWCLLHFNWSWRGIWNEGEGRLWDFLFWFFSLSFLRLLHRISVSCWHFLCNPVFFGILDVLKDLQWLLVLCFIVLVVCYISSI